jgi:sec-independent protein translocase protein TatA
MDLFGIGPLEIIFILVIGLLVFGPDKLPQIGRDIGKALRSFKKATSDISAEMSKEMKELEEQGKQADTKKGTLGVAAIEKKLEPAPLKDMKELEEQGKQADTKKGTLGVAAIEKKLDPASPKDINH